jgi:hypothetical protein
MQSVNWFESHVYIAAWASPVVTLVGFFIHNRRSLDREGIGVRRNSANAKQPVNKGDFVACNSLRDGQCGQKKM